MCIEDNGKLSAGTTCIGDECNLSLSSSSCNNKKIQGDFHTHPLLQQLKKAYNIKGSSEKVTKEFLRTREATIPSQGDIIDSIIGTCAKRTKGSVCIGTDLDNTKVECWTPNKIIGEDICLKSIFERLESRLDTPPKTWTRELYDKEIINL